MIPKPHATKTSAEQEAPANDADLKDRQTPELVVGLVGPVGSGVTTTASALELLFSETYKYSVHRIKVSELIISSAHLIGKQFSNPAPRATRILELQELGTGLRKKFNDAFLAELAVQSIAIHRLHNHGYEMAGQPEAPNILPLRMVHIIDSLKHPDEIRLLRDVYGDNFWLIGVFAPDDVRTERMQGLGLNDAEIHEIMQIDQEEGVDYGQRVRDTVHRSDFFVRNDLQNDTRLRNTLKRFLDIVFNVGVHTPTQDETAMFMAASAATNSACLSKQVGASVYSQIGELIGVGSNDVPKSGGGLYNELDLDNDHRCFKWKGKICHNDHEKNLIYKEVLTALRDKKLVKEDIADDVVISTIASTKIRSLIEFSRAVHAEMEAIISVARGNKPGIVGATLYSTTFPCHSCARHIVASGIGRVIYIEPYTKSKALTLHSDSITDNEQDGIRRVPFLQYEGVAPKNIIKLFRHGVDRKENGHLKTQKPDDAMPVFPSPLDGFSTRENLIVNKLRTIEDRSEPVGKPRS